jgi:RsiW-degrading membrane proteinase PrsW (M82 family)
MIVPLLVTGILFGYILRTKKTNVGRKLMALGCLLGGVGNAVNGAILYLFQSQTTGSSFQQGGGEVPPFARQAVSTQTPASFLILSFVIGVLIVLLVLVPAVLVQRRTFPHLPFRRREQ